MYLLSKSVKAFRRKDMEKEELERALKYANSIFDMDEKEFREKSYIDPYPLEILMDIWLNEMSRKSDEARETIDEELKKNLEYRIEELDIMTDKLQRRIVDAYNT